MCATGIYSLWSNYIDRQGERPVAPYEWANTLDVTVGLRHSYGPLRSFLDVQYVPSPVPLQTGRTNYVDNDRVSTALGLDYEFEVFEGTWRVGVQGQAHVLLERSQQKLDPLTADPSIDRAQLVRDEFPDDAVDARGQPIASATGLQTNNPGWPGFSSRGILGGAGVTLGLLF